MARAKQRQGQSSRGKKGNKKHGRNRDKCKRYRDRGTREKNKARRAAKRARRYMKRAAVREGRLRGRGRSPHLGEAKMEPGKNSPPL
jgi:hypothetical protein